MGYRAVLHAEGNSVLLLFLAATLSCTGKLDGDSGPAEATEDTGCEYAVRYEGPEEPHVGDEWEVHLTCDGADTGDMIIRIYPGELALIEGRVLTFIAAGEGKIRMQTGVHRASMWVTILP
jgi:hypothetical protein